MKNCSSCVHYVYKYTGTMTMKEKREFKPEQYLLLKEGKDTVLGDKYGLCKKGLMNDLRMFWLVYGDKPASEHKLPMDCHEDTETVKQLDKMISLTDDLIKLIDKEKKKKHEAKK